MTTANDALLIVPAFNEEHRFEESKWVEMIETCAFDIMFVDDCSTDSTLTKVLSLADRVPNVSFISMEENFGKATALFRGIHLACQQDYKFVGITDVDDSIHLDDLLMGLNLLRSKTELDLVSGARVPLSGWNIKRQKLRQWVGRIFATMIAITLKLTIYDPQSPCKWFRVSPLLRESSIQPPSTRWFGEVELVSRIMNAYLDRATNFKVFEFPLSKWHDAPKGHLNTKRIFAVTYDYIKFYRATKANKNN